MSWNDRVRQGTDLSAAIDALRAQGEVTEFVSPPDFSYGPKGPMEFERLIGSGVHKAFTVETPEDLIGLRHWLSEANDYVFGHVCYDVKNLLESVTSKHSPRVGFPLVRMVIPEHVAILQHGKWVIHSHGPLPVIELRVAGRPVIGPVHSGMKNAEYRQIVEQILHHIQLGDIYETNFCVEHFATDTVIDPALFFEHMMKDSMAPFSCRVAHGSRHLLCASPERFMTKVGDRVFSQPMKGTNRRRTDNVLAMDELKYDPKERAENIMITDLVRNDLSKFAAKGSVTVDSLCEVHPFAHINQMVSTVSCLLQEGAHPLDVLLGAFPMGSMTGAPKMRAMQLMDRYENFGRGLFSGSVGYFTPDLDFDFNVVIRSILYDDELKNLSFPTGGAITINSDPLREWEECQLKAEAMRRSLIEHGKQGS
ncbi:MAG: anthranilate synthase component I family protein [Flavobacteriales bacterium]|nr:anthranilate synthase component I family protein [Flavobacteriales bacterium]